MTGLNKPLPGIALLPDVPASEIRKTIALHICFPFRIVEFCVGDLKDSSLHFHWKNVSIRDYDYDRQLWLVTPDDREHQVYEMYRAPKRTRRETSAIEDQSQSSENSYTNGLLRK